MTQASPIREASGDGNGGFVAAGFAAGLLGGLAMALWIAGSAAVAGMDPLAPLASMGDTFAAGPREPGAGRTALGLGLHLLLSGTLGVLFTAVFRRDFPSVNALVVCVGFAWAAMGVTTTVVLPALNPFMREGMMELGGSWVLAHVVYGATVGFSAQRLRQRRPASGPTGSPTTGAA